MRLLNAFLDALSRTCSTSLWLVLLPSLREGSQHQYYTRITSVLNSLAVSITSSTMYQNNNYLSNSENSSVGNDSKSVNILNKFFSFCFQIIVDEYQEMPVKEIIFDHVVIPALMSCSEQALLEFYCQPIAGLKLKSKLAGVEIIDN